MRIRQDVWRIRRELKRGTQGLSDAIWLLRAAPELEQESARLAVACAERVLPHAPATTQTLFENLGKARKGEVHEADLFKFCEAEAQRQADALRGLTSYELFQNKAAFWATKTVLTACCVLKFSGFYKLGVIASSVSVGARSTVGYANRNTREAAVKAEESYQLQLLVDLLDLNR